MMESTTAFHHGKEKRTYTEEEKEQDKDRERTQIYTAFTPDRTLLFSPLTEAPRTQTNSSAHTTTKSEHLCNINTGLI